MSNSPIRTALCSFGMSGKVFHAPFIEVNPGFELYAVWERSSKNASKKYPHIKSFDTYEDMLADASIELVIVNTPNSTHFNYTKMALEAAKHVIVEKPFVINSPEGKILIELAKQKDKKVFVYHNRRWDSDFKTVKKVADEKLLGDIVEAEIHYDRFKEELSPKVHKEIPGPGTGALYDLGSHLIDQSLQLFGWPKAVFADIDIVRSISKVDDYFELILFYPGKRVRLKASYVVREALPSFILHGLKGSFIKSRADVQENDLQAEKIPETEGWGIEPEAEKGLLHTQINGQVIRQTLPTENGNYMQYFDEVFNAIRNNGAVPVTAEDGLKVVLIIEAAFESSRQKKLIELTQSIG
jgi:scyllo-inositol 2-dehydrogenase (NADP+)